MIPDGLEHPGTRQARRVLDEIEVGERAAKVWAWTDHYCPPEQYARIRREEQARDARRAEPPVGQLDLFT